MVYIINYRLHKPHKDYNSLYEAIRTISGTYWQNTTSSWLVESSLPVERVYDHLISYIDQDDELVVFRLSGEYYGQLENDDINWLKDVMARA